MSSNITAITASYSVSVFHGVLTFHLEHIAVFMPLSHGFWQSRKGSLNQFYINFYYTTIATLVCWCFHLFNFHFFLLAFFLEDHCSQASLWVTFFFVYLYHFTCDESFNSTTLVLSAKWSLKPSLPPPGWRRQSCHLRPVPVKPVTS